MPQLVSFFWLNDCISLLSLKYGDILPAFTDRLPS